MAIATPMGPRRASSPPRDVPPDAPIASRSERTELAALRDENKELRELVIQLSKLVIRNVMEHK